MPESTMFHTDLATFNHNGVTLEIEAAPSLERLVTDSTDPDRIPYWAVLWDAAPALARWIIEEDGWADVRVLELGCGVGLVGLCAAALGARVTQTDLFPEAAAAARANARRNGFMGIRHVVADWRHWPLKESWPVVLGSDLAYERAAHAPLLAVLERTVAPGGVALIADPGRPMSLDFFALAERAGWGVEVRQPGEGVQRWELRPPRTAF